MRVTEDCSHCKGTGKIEKWIDDDYSAPYGGDKWAAHLICKCKKATKIWNLLYTENESHTMCGKCQGLVWNT